MLAPLLYGLIVGVSLGLTGGGGSTRLSPARLRQVFAASMLWRNVPALFHPTS